MENRFLAPYNPDELVEIDDLLNQCYDKLPFSVIYPIYKWEEHLVDQDYLRAFRRLLDFFEISAQYVSALLISYLKDADLPEDGDIQQIIRLIPSKPLSFGDWINDIFLVLVKKTNTLLPDNELGRSLYRVLFSGKNGNILLGNNAKQGDEHKSVVSIRNEFFGTIPSWTTKFTKKRP